MDKEMVSEELLKEIEERRKELVLDNWCAPFTTTMAKDLIDHKEKEILFKQKEEAKKQNLPVHKKMTTAAKLRSYPTSVKALHLMCDAEEQFALSTTVDETPGRLPPEHITKVTSDAQQTGGKGISDYLRKCRRMLMIEQTLQIKHDEIRRMLETAKTVEGNADKEEKKLEQNAVLLGEFIHSSDTSYLEAKLQLEEEKAKSQKLSEEVRAEFKKIFAIKTEISQAERQLADYIECANFLELLAHPFSRDDAEPVPSDSLPFTLDGTKDERSSSLHKGSVGDLIRMNETIQRLVKNADQNSDMAPIKPPFENPHELLEMLDELRLQNLSFLKHRFFTQESLLDAEMKYKEVKASRDQEKDIIQKKVNDLNTDISEVEYRIERLKKSIEKMKLENISEEENEEKAKLEEEVVNVFNACVGTSTESMSALDMLAEIEEVLVSLLEQIARLPNSSVFQMFKVKMQDRMNREKEEAEEERLGNIRERMRRNLERAEISNANKMRRRLMYRSQPVEKEIDPKEVAQRQQEIEEEEYAIYFT